MPWHISNKKEGCSGYAVVKDDTDAIVSCHKDKASAEAQMRALYASEADKGSGTGISPPSKNPDQGVIKPSRQMRIKKDSEIITDETAGDMHDHMDEWQGLNERQSDQAESYCEIIMDYGQFDQSSGPDGAHYGDGSKNPFKSDGLLCENCIFFEEGACHLVSGQIDPNGICKLWIIPSESLSVDKSESASWRGIFLPQ